MEKLKLYLQKPESTQTSHSLNPKTQSSDMGKLTRNLKLLTSGNSYLKVEKQDVPFIRIYIIA